MLTAASASDALLVCEAHASQIHLLLTDVVMPQMGGRGLAERVAVLRPGTKVLYMSGYTDNAIVNTGILNKEVSFLQKPFTPDTLLAKVREVLDANS